MLGQRWPNAFVSYVSNDPLSLREKDIYRGPTDGAMMKTIRLRGSKLSPFPKTAQLYPISNGYPFPFYLELDLLQTTRVVCQLKPLEIISLFSI